MNLHNLVQCPFHWLDLALILSMWAAHTKTHLVQQSLNPKLQRPRHLKVNTGPGKMVHDINFLPCPLLIHFWSKAVNSWKAHFHKHKLSLCTMVLKRTEDHKLKAHMCHDWGTGKTTSPLCLHYHGFASYPETCTQVCKTLISPLKTFRVTRSGHVYK